MSTSARTHALRIVSGPLMAAAMWKAVYSLLLSLALTAQAAAVGPYFENELAPGDRTAGPAPDLKRPEPPPKSPQSRKVVKGQLIKTDHSTYVLKDVSGMVIELKVDANTRMQVVPKVGDQVEAEVMSDGTTRSIQPVP